MRKFLSAATITIGACLFAQAAAAHNSHNRQTNNAPPVSTENANANNHVPAAKGGTILNTDVTPEQAKKTAEATNRQILQHKTGRAK
jgi:hypothetical protein